LDLARDGPVFLRQDAIAHLVVDSLFRGVELGHYKLGSFAVLANHVHVLLLPEISPSCLLKSLKGHTAREANRLLGRTGEPFWQRESYDRCVRDSAEFARIATYIENNPLKAGLVQRPGEYAWSSGNPRWRERMETQTRERLETQTRERLETRTRERLETQTRERLKRQTFTRV